MKDNMILILVDECGDEVEFERYTINDDLDEDFLELWKMQKIEKAYEQYPEARQFYFEDRRDWNKQFRELMYGEFEDDYDPREDEDYEEEDDLSGEAYCDLYGECLGSDCRYWQQCQG